MTGRSIIPKQSAESRYKQNVNLFKLVRLQEKKSLRDVALETGVDHCTIHRMEHYRDISAMAYVALIVWAVMNNRNIRSGT